MIDEAKPATDAGATEAAPNGPLYLEDVRAGMTWTTRPIRVTEEMIAQFAELTGDDNPLHTDAEFTRRMGHPAVIAHGLFGMGLLIGLLAEIGPFNGSTVALLGFERWQFRQPVYAGMSIQGRIRVESVRESKSRPQEGVVVRHMELITENGDVVQQGVSTALVMSRDHQGSTL